MKYNRKYFEEATEGIKLKIIADELNLATHNSVTKADLLMFLKWIYEEAIDHEEYDRQKRKEWIKRRTRMEESINKSMETNKENP